MWWHNSIDWVIINYGEIEKQRQQSYTLSNQTGSSLNFNSIICQHLFVKVEDHALIGSKLSKHEVPLTRILIFKNVNRITLDACNDKDINKI